MIKRLKPGEVCQHRNNLYGRGVIKTAELIDGRMKYTIRLNNTPRGSTSNVIMAWEHQLTELKWR